jgi:isopenicillin-N N-acyltransferase-like protein
MTIPGLAFHRSREPTPGERGLALGRAQAGAIANTVAVYTRLFAEDVGLDAGEVERLGQEVGSRLREPRPDLVEEIEGIAEGAGQSPADLFAVNARTELLAGGRLAGGAAECSVAARVATGGGRHTVLAQNWDFHPDLAGSRLVWVVELDDEHWFATFTEAGIVAKTGINGAGLAVALNYLASSEDGGIDGVPVHIVLRTLLDRCEDAAAASRLLRSLRPPASACITVVAGGSRGSAAATSYELSPVATTAVDADERGLLAHTNHFLATLPARDLTLEGAGAASTLRRLATVRAGLRHVGDGSAVEDLRVLLSEREQREPVYRLADPSEAWVTRSATLATLVYDVTARRMWVRADGGPEAPLAEVPLPSGA